MTTSIDTQAASTHQVERLQKLIDISRDLASTLALDRLLDRIVMAAAELTDSGAASILLYDPTKEVLFFQSASNMDRPFMRGLVVPVASSIAGWIVRNREPVIVEDPNADPRFYATIQKESKTKTDNLLGVPLIVKDQVIGVLEAINKKEGSFGPEDQEILMTLGSQAAVAIENARLFAQSDLIAEMVHELRTPLASLGAATHILLRPNISDTQRASIIQIIQGETQRLNQMTTDFLDLARLESGRTEFSPHVIDLNLLLGECIGLTRPNMEQKRIRFSWQLPEDLPKLTGDTDKLKQVFLNLLSNAVKYNREGGEIVVAAKASGSELSISISDTGPGIPSESLTHLFEKFYRVPGTERMAHGTGLGLSIVHRIVQAHGGRVEVSSVVGKGTTFTVHLPLHGVFL